MYVYVLTSFISICDSGSSSRICEISTLIPLTGMLLFGRLDAERARVVDELTEMLVASMKVDSSTFRPPTIRTRALKTYWGIRSGPRVQQGQATRKGTYGKQTVRVQLAQGNTRRKVIVVLLERNEE